MNQIYATSPADSRKGVHRAIIIFLLCISIVLSIGSIAISAAESTTYEVNLSDAKIIGTVSLIIVRFISSPTQQQLQYLEQRRSFRKQHILPIKMVV